MWQSLILKTIFWLATEIVFNFVGLDNLADYSEYIFDPKQVDETLVLSQK